jgi:polysaccharide export outer membrane protein
MKIKNIYILISFGLLLVIQSCGINSDLMLKTPKDYVFDKLDVESANAEINEYIVKVDDIIKFKFYTNKGQKVLDLVTRAEGGTQSLGFANSMTYTIMPDSLVKLPVIGNLNIVGKSIKETELFIENEFKSLYVDPFVQISVTNKRVIVFPGSGGDSKVVYLTNNNTTLLEVLALAGGITERGRASKIKLMRGEKENKKVYLIDLSTIDGLKYADLIIQNGDYLYIEPVPELGKEILKEIAPVVTIISSAAVIISVLTLFK